MRVGKSTTGIIIFLAVLAMTAALMGVNIAPSLINYQARLTDDQGAALIGNYQLTFTIYDADIGGTALWTETHSSVAVDDGLFSVLLGNGDSRTAIDETVFAAAERWLAISVNGGPELTPRTRLVSVPYSQRVNTVDKARGGIISGQVEIQENVAKGGGFRVDDPRLIIRGIGSRQISLAPNDNVILQAQDDVGNTSMEALYTPDGGSIAISDENGQTAAQLSATADGASLDLWNTNASKLSQRKWSLTEGGLVRFGANDAETLFVVKDVNGVTQMAFDDPAAKSLGFGSFFISPPSQSLGPPGTVFYGTDASGDARFSAQQSVGGATSVSFYGAGLEDGSALGPKQMEFGEEAFRLFGSTEDDTLVVIRRPIENVGAIEVHDQASAEPTSITIGNGTALSFKDQSGTAIAEIGTASNTLSGGLAVRPSSASLKNGRDVGDFLNYYGIDNTFLTDEVTGFAEKVLIVGDSNTVGSKSVLVVGDSNKVQGSGVLNANGSVTFGRANTQNGDNSFIFGERNQVGSARSTAFGRFNITQGGGDNYIFGDSCVISSVGDGSITGGSQNTLVNATLGHIGGGNVNEINSSLYSTIGGGQQNLIDQDTFSVRQDNITIAGGSSNTARGQAATVGGGDANAAIGGATTVSGGIGNFATATNATVGGGDNNSATAEWAVVAGGGGGGFANRNRAEGVSSAVVGGARNIASGDSSFVGGGASNVASGLSSAIPGGHLNIASGDNSTVIGGVSNEATNTYAIAGGYFSSARDIGTVALGKLAKSNHRGSIIISANASNEESDSVRTGGAGQIVLRCDTNVYITNTAEQAPANDNTKLINTVAGAYLSSGGTWVDASDRNLKENFAEVDPEDLLDRIRQLPISSWNYKAASDDIKHIGPVAQDFYRIFGIGIDDKSISPRDLASISLVAIKELDRKTRQLETTSTRVEQLESEITELKSLVIELLKERQ